MSAKAAAINAAGDVAGSVADAAGISHAALWRGELLTDLGTPPGYLSATALALDDGGTVLITAWGKQDGAFPAPGVPFLWRHEHFCRPDGLPPRPYPAAVLNVSAMNNTGQLAGVYTDTAGWRRPFVWTAGRWQGFGAEEQLGFVMGEYQTASVSALNDSGVFVGEVRVLGAPSEERPYAIVRRGRDFDVAFQSDAWRSVAASVNNSGDVLGIYQNGKTSPEVTFLLRGGRNLLKFPPRVPPGAAGSRVRRRALVPMAMNGGGVWVGAFDGGPPVIVHPGGELRLLPMPPDLVGRLVAPTAVNDSDVVVGWAAVPSRGPLVAAQHRGVALVWRGGRVMRLPLTSSAPATPPR